MAAIGFCLPQTAFTSLMKQVPTHVLRYHIGWSTETFVPRSTIYMCFGLKLMTDGSASKHVKVVTLLADLQGPHLLAPTGSDLSKYGQLNNVFAGYHYDLNFLTIHGRSRFPGLFIWLKDGRKVPVKVPEGCLLLQAGKQVII